MLFNKSVYCATKIFGQANFVRSKYILCNIHLSLLALKATTKKPKNYVGATISVFETEDESAKFKYAQAINGEKPLQRTKLDMDKTWTKMVIQTYF